MTLRPFLIATAVYASLSAASHAQTVALPSDAEAAEARRAPTPPAISTNEMLEFYGWYLGQQFQCEALGLSEPEIEALTRGIKLASEGKRTQADPRVVGPALERFITSRAETVEKKRLADSQAEEETFLAAIDQKESVKKTASGLRYEVLTEGTGPKPGPSDEVRVHYRGTFVDGSEFDSSIARGEPATFPVNRVIPGWSEGVQLMTVGGKYMFYVPGNLAYGLRGSDGIPPGKLLIFEVELLATTPPAPQLPGAGTLPTLAP